MTKVYSIWCEYDIGQNTELYGSREAAVWQAKFLYEMQMGEDTFDQALNDGLVSVEEHSLNG